MNMKQNKTILIVLAIFSIMILSGCTGKNKLSEEDTAGL